MLATAVRRPRSVTCKLLSGLLALLLVALLPPPPRPLGSAPPLPAAADPLEEAHPGLEPARAVSPPSPALRPATAAAPTDPPERPPAAAEAGAASDPATAGPDGPVPPARPGVALAAPGPVVPPDPPLPVRRVETEEKLYALTFDDGPYPGLTERYLAALAARDVRATFFLVGSRVRRYPKTAAAIVAGGHEVANHSLYHTDLSTRTGAEAEADLAEANAVLAALKAPPRLFRPPYGHWQEEVLRAAAAVGLEPVTWSVDPQDWRDPAPEVIVERVLAELHPGAIILLHEGHPYTALALPLLLDALAEKGYRPVTVSELLASGRAVRATSPTP